MKLSDSPGGRGILSYTAWYMHLKWKLLCFASTGLLLLVEYAAPSAGLWTTGWDTGFPFRSLGCSASCRVPIPSDVGEDPGSSQGRKVLSSVITGGWRCPILLRWLSPMAGILLGSMKQWDVNKYWVPSFSQKIEYVLVSSGELGLENYAIGRQSWLIFYKKRFHAFSVKWKLTGCSQHHRTPHERLRAVGFTKCAFSVCDGHLSMRKGVCSTTQEAWGWFEIETPPRRSKKCPTNYNLFPFSKV